VRIMVIGATGHIGTWLVPRLVAAGHDVIAVSRGDRQPYETRSEWSSVKRMIMDRAAMEADGSFGPSIAALGADVVVDLICFTPASAQHIVNSLRGRVAQFIHCGTLWVHGNPRTRPYSETEPREPFGEYGILKADIERLLLAEASAGFPATILHPGHITGPGWMPINPAGNLDAGVFDRLSRGERVALPDDGSATLQHVHVDDVAQAFELAITNPAHAIGEAFHVAARLPVTMRSYAEQAATWFGQDAQLEFLPLEEWTDGVSQRDAWLTRDHVSHSPHASIEKAERVLGFTPRFTAVEAARDAVEFMRRNAA
jgi:nucleoside-diphosphate-sugar epimerase